MIKLLKWAFRLGQQTERQRIEHILNEQRRYQPPDRIARQLFGKEFDDLPDKKKDSLKFEHSVDIRINDIIHNITRPQTTESESYSLLYPKEAEK